MSFYVRILLKHPNLSAEIQATFSTSSGTGTAFCFNVIAVQVYPDHFEGGVKEKPG
jgi:hypothetical protein